MKKIITSILLINAWNVEIAEARPFGPSFNFPTQSSTHTHLNTLRGGAFRDKSLQGRSVSWSRGPSISPSQSNSFSQRGSRPETATTTTTATTTRLSDDFSDKKSSEREMVKEEINTFLTRESRNTFIARVYAILTGQLTFVSLVILAFMKFPQLSQWTLIKGGMGELHYYV